MHSHTFAALIGGGLVVVFLLYYVIYIASVPLSFIMVAMIIMICVNMYEESREQIDNDNNS
jgi:MFS superfamily sulfate permease-like transporter